VGVTTAVVPESETTSPPAQKSNQTAPQVIESGAIVVNSIPDGGEVYADDAFIGNCPATLKLIPGKHYIRVFLRDYKNWSREISVLAGSEVNLTATLEKTIN